jgi:hypothetical protein
VVDVRTGAARPEATRKGIWLDAELLISLREAFGPRRPCRRDLRKLIQDCGAGEVTTLATQQRGVDGQRIDHAPLRFRVKHPRTPLLYGCQLADQSRSSV